MHRCIHQILRRTITRLLWSTTFTCTLRLLPFTKLFQYCRRVRLILITRYQTGSPVFQAFRRQMNQPSGVLEGAFTIDHLQHKFVLCVQRNVIPVIAAVSIGRIVFVAMFFFFVHEVPLFVELDFFALGGKEQRVRREVVRRVRRQVLSSG